MFRISKHRFAKEPFHLRARPGDVAEKVIAVGDPGRARLIAENLLSEPRLVSENRGYLTYTGHYGGCRVTVATHGIGAPSAAIVFEELAMLGARTIVRLGTCGGLRSEVQPGEVVVAEGAAYRPGGTLDMYAPSTCFPAAPTPELTVALAEEIAGEGVRVHRGLVASSDAFHSEEEYLEPWSRLGLVAVEMECATLFTVARIRGLRSGAALVVVDNLATGSYLGDPDISPVVLRAARGILRALVRQP